jgi:hypothetical protein
MDVIELLIIIFVNVITVFFTAYFSQKGKDKAIVKSVKRIAEQTKLGENMAIKKDIEEISSKIKSVETAILEASSKKQDKFFQLRNAITDFANDLTVLVECKFKIIPIGNDFFTPVETRAKFKDFISQWATVSCSYRRIILFSNIDYEFINQIHEKFLCIVKQYEITVEYFDAILINSIIVGDDKTPTLNAVKKMNDAQEKYIVRRDGSEKVQNEAFHAYNVILQILNTRLMEKYNEK